ncbi:hypothetical protein [Rhodovulum sp. 12E13]|uniref:hypothetical protein n=1 Tax=Rhodovulum sp. 12E13 TaxID=2203891 RepID=UPI001314E6F3|nr:hypothetical protein [Rhodovulum sp. 12E13]
MKGRPMRRAYPVLHILLIAAMLVAAIAAADENTVASGQFLPERTAAAVAL